MKKVDIPGYGVLAFEHLVLDYNGTMAVDGRLVHGVGDALNKLADDLAVHVVTADTFGQAREQLSGVRCHLTILEKAAQDQGKRDYITRLGPEKTAAIGNGRNDGPMLKAARLGICVVIREGACMATVTVADIVCNDILDALGLLIHPLRLKATLRS